MARAHTDTSTRLQHGASVACLQGRAGYLQWREQLKGSHAATVVGLMQQAGYDAAACEKVKRWILKKDIKTDAENQVRGWRIAAVAAQWNNSPSLNCVCVCTCCDVRAGGGGRPVSCVHAAPVC